MMMYSKERYIVVVVVVVVVVIVVVVVTFSIKLDKSCQARGEKLYKIVGGYEHYCGFVFPALFFSFHLGCNYCFSASVYVIVDTNGR